MAERKKVEIVCDRHRGDVLAVGVLEIIIDGQRRKLDLCADHLRDARRELKPWTRVALTGREPRRRSRSTPSGRRKASADLRAWAEANGYDLPGRGRIPAEVHVAYAAAQ